MPIFSAHRCALCKNVTRKYSDEIGNHIVFDCKFLLPGELNLLTNYSLYDVLVRTYWLKILISSKSNWGWGDLGFFQLLQSNSSPEGV